MLDYERFGDCLVFDSTYKTNRYQKPLVILSGVNNHFQTTVFGCAVLSDETTETYMWVLDRLLEVMKGKKPISVITDGDLAMKNAIEVKFPGVRHRLCAWHLCRNAEGTMKLGADFMKDFGKLLKRRLTDYQWYERWKEMVEKWNIGERRWIVAAYISREAWAETFLKSTFFAGQTTTQRCESINKFFKEYLNYKNNLLELCMGFMRGLEKLRDNERAQHSISHQSEPVLTTQFRKFEEHAARVYTRAVYRMFKIQALKATRFNLTDVCIIDGTGGCFSYGLKKNTGTQTLHTVLCPPDNTYLMCTCQHFESTRMLCAHIIFIMHQRGLEEIPAEMISDRWSKTNQNFYVEEPAMREPRNRVFDNPSMQALRQGLMADRMKLLSNLGSANERNYKCWEKGVADLIKTMQENIAEDQSQLPSCTTSPPPDYSNVRPPKPSDTRPKGSKRTGKGSRRCGNCGQPGHNRTTCKSTTGPSQSTPGTDDIYADIPAQPEGFDALCPEELAYEYYYNPRM